VANGRQHQDAGNDPRQDGIDGGCWEEQCSAFTFVRGHRDRQREYELEALAKIDQLARHLEHRGSIDAPTPPEPGDLEHGVGVVEMGMKDGAGEDPYADAEEYRSPSETSSTADSTMSETTTDSATETSARAVGWMF
jgi:hypothetical protein